LGKSFFFKVLHQVTLCGQPYAQVLCRIFPADITDQYLPADKNAAAFKFIQNTGLKYTAGRQIFQTRNDFRPSYADSRPIYCEIVKVLNVSDLN